ncbi:CHAD domain-containing protein [Lichenicoccus sp.]|uniref:CYTH and CHAD domain-containing protein n=1 Tax=Lichenicoccus sp. TaxID=2781899 RepID=UPI003D0DDB42
MQVTRANSEPTDPQSTAAQDVPVASQAAPAAKAEPRRLWLQPDPESVALLRRAPVIARHARNAGITRRIETTYYDTPDRLLFRGNLSLRVRTLGRRFIQTLSGRASQASAASGTWSCSVASALPDLADLGALQADWLPPAVREALLRGPLALVCTARIRRHTRRLAMPDALAPDSLVPGSLVDVVFEDGGIEAQGRHQGIDRIGLVLHAGEASALYEVALRLLDVAPLRIGADSTALLGYALATQTHLRAAKATASSLTPALAMDDAIAAILAACQTHLQANQGVAQNARTPDGVHQMRVALRRVRSALSLLRRDLPSGTMASLAREAKWAAAQLGPARGWDVFLASTLNDTLTQRTRAPRGGPDFQALRQAAEAPRARAYRTVTALITAPRFSRFQLTLGQWAARRGWRNEVTPDGLALLADPASLVAAGMLGRLHRKALRQGAHFRRLSATERHQLRITLKKLRYAIEFFLPLFEASGRAHRFVRRLSRLQEALGLDHDAAETRPLLVQLGGRGSAGGIHQAIGVVIGWQAREELVNLDTLAAQWQRFKTLQPFWPKVSKPLSAGSTPAAPRPG